MKVMRGGKKALVTNLDVVVGDVLLLDTGDKIVADGFLVETHGLVVDEASLTGESEPIKKTAADDPWCMSGTQVCSAGRGGAVAGDWGRWEGGRGAREGGCEGLGGLPCCWQGC